MVDIYQRLSFKCPIQHYFVSEIVRSDNLRLISELSRLFYWVCRKSQARLVGLVDSWLVIQCGAHKGLYQATGDTMGNTTIWYDIIMCFENLQKHSEAATATVTDDDYINIHHRVMDEPLLQLRQDLFATLVESAGGNMEGTPQCGLFSVWCHVASVCCSVQFIDLCMIITCITSLSRLVVSCRCSSCIIFLYFSMLEC